MLDLMLAIIRVNDHELNNLLKLKKAHDLPIVNDAIVSKLCDLHNPSTSDDHDINLIKSALNL